MSLRIYLLGQFKLQADELPIELPSRPAQSLLAYLALNAGVTHRREKLASLIWPEATETNARSYLRQALWRIHKSLEGGSFIWEDYLHISDIEVAFNAGSDYWLDVDHLLETAEGKSVDDLIETVCLYRGELLPGFYEEWVVTERDRLQAAYHQKMNALVTRLGECGRWDDVLKWGEEWIQLGQSPEPAFRALMKAYANLGDQSMVSATYQRCVDGLDRELGLDPSPETRRLYEGIIREQHGYAPSRPIITGLASQSPSFLDEAKPEKVERTVFVAREAELAQMEGYLELALSGKGRVAFITGEVGSGKTALIQEFSRRALATHPGLVIAGGQGNAHTGMGDPYLPFREILGLLTGDVEARWAAGAITKEHARRLWNMLPIAASALMDSSLDLIDTFIPGLSLMNRAMAYAPGGADWLVRLKEAVERKGSSSFILSPQQSDLFEQYTRVLRALAREVPLMLVLDDLQWADAGSIDLLFHLGRQLGGCSILIVGAYRQEEVTLGRQGERHPLEPVVNELQRELGAIFVNLGGENRREFVEALLDSEPNRLRSSFREKLYRQTQGHPLFTVELLRGMQDRGDLVQDQKGQLVEGSSLDWETMPARVEAVIAERIGRLPQPSQAVLRAASVEGEMFTAEVVARVMEIEARELLARLSGELDRRHRLIRAERIQRTGGQLLSSYRFRHILFQKFLYTSLDEVERAHLHERVGTLLEGLYIDQEEIPEFALQLARHFEEAGVIEKAIRYLRQAGERAVQLSAYQEGIAPLRRGLELLALIPDSPKRDQEELMLQLSFAKAWRCQGPSPQAIKAINRARELCQQLGEPAQLSRVLGELSIYHYVRAEHQQALDIGGEALSLAQQAEEPMLEAEGHWHLGFINFGLGDYPTAKTHLDKVLSFYNPEQHHNSFVLLRGVDAGLSAMAYDACCLWCLGYPDQALKRGEEVLALAQEFDHPFTLADVFCYAGCMLNQMRREPSALKENAEALIRLADEKSLEGYLGMAVSCLGEALAMLGQDQEAIAQIREGMGISESTSVKLYRSVILRSLAKAQGEAGNTQNGLALLAEALEMIEKTGERHWEAELYLLRGEFLDKQGDEAGAEDGFRQAIQVSRSQRAKSWELRAATGLARLWQKQGRVEEARELLEPVYNWFTEGFETPDLIEAQELLQELG
jgi:adenylate cyclase